MSYPNKNASSKAGAHVCKGVGPEKQTANKKSIFDDTGNAASAQRSRLLTALKKQSVTTIDARRDLDIFHPAQRVLELRAEGFDIKMSWCRELSDCGALHRVGKYLLASLAPIVGGAP